MSALARFYQAAGFEVYGYDLTATPLTDELMSEPRLGDGLDVGLLQRVVGGRRPATHDALIMASRAASPAGPTWASMEYGRVGHVEHILHISIHRPISFR